jgi:hypothetical protein
MSKQIIRIFAVAFVVLTLGVSAGSSLARNTDLAPPVTDISAQKRAKAGNVNVNRNVNKNVSRDVNVNRNVNVNVNKRTNVVVRRPVRVWVRRPYYGAVIGGVVLGTVIAATVVGTAPVAPAANLCWFWADQGMVQGYWDYCVVP